jgi:hypothetical protein
MNTGVERVAHDPGVGGVDAAGRPWSLAAQYAALLQGEKPPDPSRLVQVSSCDFSVPFERDFDPKELARGAFTPLCLPRASLVPKRSVARREAAQPGGGRLRVASEGAFKIPSLRNVELTGPYMHNGGLATLRQVLEFYSRGGNTDEIANPNLAGFVFASLLTDAEKDDLEAFLRSLTDERVRFEREPFDHPALRVPDGHVAGPDGLVPGTLPGRDVPMAADDLVVVPAVGRDGRTPEQGPLQPFEARLGP